MALKLILIGPQGTVGSDGKASTAIIDDLVKFIKRMQAKGVRVAFWSRTQYMYRKKTIQQYFTEATGTEVMFFQAGHGGLPIRQKGGSVDPILKSLKVEKRETILVGCTESDMQAGVNNELLFIRSNWYKNDLAYGFSVPSVTHLARFCELFGLRQHPIYWSIDDGDLQVRAMGPFSTYLELFADFGNDAKSAAKQGLGNPKFWLLMIVSSLYFSGIAHEIDYICRFPGHDPAQSNSTHDRVDNVMIVFSKCFRKPFLQDFIVRHKASTKSQTMKSAEKNFLNHINTIHLSKHPKKYGKKAAKKALDLKHKTVLVVDDFCTNGRSLDVAGAYIDAAGGKSILFAWLKTINTDFFSVDSDLKIDPFKPNNLKAEPKHVTYAYRDHIVDHAAPKEIDTLLKAYKAWAWT